MNPLANLSYQDIVSIALVAGVKIGGGDWKKALLWGFGSKFIMGYIGFPSMDPCPQAAQGLMQTASQLFQRVMGPMPQQQQVAAQGPVTDAQYEDQTGYQGQQVPAPGQ